MKGYMSLPVGLGGNCSIRDIICYMKEQAGSSSDLLFGSIPLRNGEPDTLANISWFKLLIIK